MASERVNFEVPEYLKVAFPETEDKKNTSA